MKGRGLVGSAAEVFECLLSRSQYNFSIVTYLLVLTFAAVALGGPDCRQNAILPTNVAAIYLPSTLATCPLCSLWPTSVQLSVFLCILLYLKTP